MDGLSSNLDVVEPVAMEMSSSEDAVVVSMETKKSDDIKEVSMETKKSDDIKELCNNLDDDDWDGEDWDEEAEESKDEETSKEDPNDLLADLQRLGFLKGRDHRDPFSVDVVDALLTYIRTTKDCDLTILNRASQVLEECCSRYSARVDVAHQELNDVAMGLGTFVSSSNHKNDELPSKSVKDE